MLDTTKDWETTKISEFEVYSLKESKNKLRTVLLAELSVMPTFLVSPKDSYDIAILVDQGLRLFPSALMSKVPETEKDAAEVSVR